MKLKKDVYKYILRLLDLNINFSDGLQKGFQFGVWDTENHLFYTDIEEKSFILFRKTKVVKRQIIFNIFELSIQIWDQEYFEICEKADSLLSEIIFDNFKLDFLMFLNWKSEIRIDALQFFLVQENKKY